MGKIKRIEAREIIDADGWPTIEAVVILDDGLQAKASVPGANFSDSGQVFILRDGDEKRYRGRGVLRAVSKINEIIAPALVGQKIKEQAEIDQKLLALDGTADRHHLGANSILAVSLACARAGAIASGQELFEYLKASYDLGKPGLPRPLFNIFNGGRQADTNLDFEEFLLLPQAGKMAEMIRQGAETFQELGRVLKESGHDTDTGSEGGYAPDIDSSIEAIEMIMAASLRAGYEPGKAAHLGIDIGSSALYESASGRYVFPLDGAYLRASGLINLYDEWLKKYPIAYLEDGLAADDWESWRRLTMELGSGLTIAGDDLFMSDEGRLRRGLQEKAANAILIKPSQVATLTETLGCIKLAKKNGYQVVIGRQAGETADDFLADLAVAVAANYIKAGSLSRAECLAKYNRLLEISKVLEK
jgi:enolase